MTVVRERDGLLKSVRVLDVGGAESDGVGRILADLGADVVKIMRTPTSPGGERPTVGGVSIPFVAANANKRCGVLDPDSPADRTRLVDLAGGADVVIDSGNPGHLDRYGTSCADLVDRFPTLVGLSVTDFGLTGPRAGWVATDAVLYAMSTSLSRSGPTSGRPVLPPRGIASGTAAAQAAWATLIAYFNRIRCGRGDFIDFSRYEGVLQTLDPPFGSEGQAAVGQKPPAELWPGRPRNQQLYPIFGCADGSVRICLLSGRQWRGMRAWLGEPEQFCDPALESMAARYAASRAINAAIAALCEHQTVASLVATGQQHGVPIAAVLSPAQALTTDHLQGVGALTRTTVAADTELTVPVGPMVVDGLHPVFTPPDFAADIDWLTRVFDEPPLDGAPGSRPFAGLRVVDLGVIVAGGETGRLFADMGADVIKVESAAYPDGLRQTPPGMAMSRSWALTHRNEYSVGIDLRHPVGAELFGRLVSGADLVLANFKPGTLASLGFSFDDLRALNPRIVLAESSAFGATGPWSERMGYGPLVRASTGITRLWTSEDAGDSTYDATTIFPDHVAARLTAIAALAALIRRDRTDHGAHVHVSQAEAAINQLAVTYVADAATAAGLPVVAGAGLDTVHPCSGEDEWLAISLRGDHDRAALARVMGRADLPEGRAEFIEAVSAFTVGRDNHELAEVLQQNGIPAGPMLRAADVLNDPQVLARNLYADMTHPLFDKPLPSETGPSRYRRIPPADLRPAPVAGEHTREICQKLLGLDTDETERLIADAVVFEPSTLQSPDGPER